MKKGRHRRFEEARALKRNQDLDFDSIFDSLSNAEDDSVGSGDSTAFDSWADEFDEEESTDSGEKPGSVTG